MRKSNNEIVKISSFGAMEETISSLHRKKKLLPSKTLETTLVTIGFFSAGYRATSENSTYIRKCGVSNRIAKSTIPNMEPFASIPDHLDLVERIGNSSILVMPTPTTFLPARPAMLNFLLDLEKRSLNLNSIYFVYMRLAGKKSKLASDRTVLAAIDLLVALKAGKESKKDGTPLERVLAAMDSGVQLRTADCEVGRTFHEHRSSDEYDDDEYDDENAQHPSGLPSPVSLTAGVAVPVDLRHPSQQQQIRDSPPPTSSHQPHSARRYSPYPPPMGLVRPGKARPNQNLERAKMHRDVEGILDLTIPKKRDSKEQQPNPSGPSTLCRASNQAGDSDTAATLTVEPLEPTKIPAFGLGLSSNVMARTGQRVPLECAVSAGLPREEKEHEAARQWMEEQIDELESLGNSRTPLQEEQLRALKVELEFRKQAMEAEQQNKDYHQERLEKELENLQARCATLERELEKCKKQQPYESTPSTSRTTPQNPPVVKPRISRLSLSKAKRTQLYGKQNL